MQRDDFKVLFNPNLSMILQRDTPWQKISFFAEPHCKVIPKQHVCQCPLPCHRGMQQPHHGRSRISPVLLPPPTSASISSCSGKGRSARQAGVVFSQNSLLLSSNLQFMDFLSRRRHFCGKERISKPLKETGVHQGVAPAGKPSRGPGWCVPVIHLQCSFPGEMAGICRGGRRREGGGMLLLRLGRQFRGAAARESSKPAGRAAPGSPGAAPSASRIPTGARAAPKGLGQRPGGLRDTQHLWQLTPSPLSLCSMSLP